MYGDADGGNVHFKRLKNYNLWAHSVPHVAHKTSVDRNMWIYKHASHSNETLRNCDAVPEILFEFCPPPAIFDSDLSAVACTSHEVTDGHL